MLLNAFLLPLMLHIRQPQTPSDLTVSSAQDPAGTTSLQYVSPQSRLSPVRENSKALRSPLGGLHSSPLGDPAQKLNIRNG